MRVSTLSRPLLGLLIACGMGGAWSAGETGDSRMFSLFGGSKGPAPVTAVAAEVKAELRAGGSFPASTATPPALVGARCSEVHVADADGAAQWAPQALAGQTRRGFRVDGLTGQPPLLLLNGRTAAGPAVEFWELPPDGAPRAQQRRSMDLDAAQPSWAGFAAEQLLCLPGEQLLLVLRYHDPAARRGLYRYDAAARQWQRVAPRIEPDALAGLPPLFATLLPVRADAALVLYHTDALRLAPEVYVNRQDHLLLFSRRHPKGLKVLTLGIDKGNVQRAVVSGTTLWLQTLDARVRGRPVQHLWSLDLGQVL